MTNYGWVGTILRVDLTTSTITKENTSKYNPTDYLGGRGFGAQIAWNEIPASVGPFDPENKLMFFTGPLVGTMSPCSSRCTVCGVGAQNAHMYKGVGGYTWSGIGGRFGAEMKFAGYDGIIIQGASSTRVYLLIQDDQVQILSATNMWGMTTGGTIRTLMRRHGNNTKCAVIGPAGENKSRIAAILTDSGSAAGQGGFGGVMGSKGLKAIAIQGSGKINVFDNESLMATVNKINRESDKSVSAAYVTAGHAKQTYSVTSRKTPCTMGCQAYCGWPTFQTNNLAQTGQALPVDITASDFCFGISASVGYEANYICNQLGINGWEFAYGMQPVLEYASQQHILTQVDGIPIPAPTYTIINGRKDTMSNTLVATLLNKLAYRSDPLGDAMAEGVVLMAQKLWPTYPGSAFTNVDTVLTRAYPGYPAFSSGMTGHWDCHWAHTQLKYPHWLVSALIWSVANRDPADDSVHSWGENVANWWGKPMCDGTNLSWPDRIAPVSQRLYGTTQTMDPNISFDPPEAKAYGARFHKWHGALTSSLLLCDWQMPRVFSIRNMPDPHTYPQAESEMFSAVTGINTTEQAMLTDGERICNLERAIDVRYGRKRAWDEAVIPYFSEPSGDTVVDYKTAFNANKFKAQITAMYTMFGWDTVTGWPKRAKLESLGLKYVADGLASIGKPPI